MKKAYLETTGRKQATRETFTQAVKQYIDNPSHILLMPGEEAHDAKLLRGMFPQTKIKGIRLCDPKDPDIKEQLATHWQCIDGDPYPGTVSGYRWHASNRDNPDNPDRGKDVYHPMDAIWLDHTGGCTEKNVDDIIQMVHYAAKDKCVFAVTFTTNPRRGTESADTVISNNAWFDAHERYDQNGQHWSDDHDQAKRKMMNTHDKVANAVRSAIEKGYTGEYVMGRIPDKKNPWEAMSFRRLNIIHSETYNSRKNSTPMHFFIIYIEKI